MTWQPLLGRFLVGDLKLVKSFGRYRESPKVLMISATPEPLNWGETRVFCSAICCLGFQSAMDELQTQTNITLRGVVVFMSSI